MEVKYTGATLRRQTFFIAFLLRNAQLFLLLSSCFDEIFLQT